MTLISDPYTHKLAKSPQLHMTLVAGYNTAIGGLLPTE